MKIGLVIDDTLDKTDGVQQYVLTLGAWLKSEGHRVHYLAGQTERKDIRNVHSLGKNISVRFNQNRLSVPLWSRKKDIKALLAKEKFDVLHVQMPYSPLLAGRIIHAAPKRTAVVGTFHILPYSFLEQLATTALGMVLSRSLRRFNAICSVSEAARIFAASTFNTASVVIPNAIQSLSFKTTKPKRQDKVKIVFLGRLVPRKGAMELLQAITALPQRARKRIQVEIGGRGPLLEDLQRYVSANDLESIVTFHGFVDESAKPAFLRQADIAVFPSISGESFGIVLLEAMASKAGVVLGGDNPGYRCVLGERPELLVNPIFPKAFAHTLNELISDEPLRNELHRWQQKHVRQFDISVVGPQIISMYETAIAKQRNN